MKNQSLAFLFFFFAFLFQPVKAQHFFDDHTGHYEGTLLLLYPGRAADSVAFCLDIAKTAEPGRWQNKLTYRMPAGSQEKNYEQVLDSAFADNTHYILDEKDGILIAETLLGNTLYCNYTVEGSFYVVRTTFHTGSIDYELSCYKSTEKTESVSDPDEKGTSWKVDSYPLLTVQKGTLIKQRPEK